MPENFFKASTLDDLLHEVLERLLSQDQYVSASRGRMTELFGATLILDNPRARLSRSESKGKLFSALGELLWYLSGANDLDFIRYYVGEQYVGESEDGATVRSGYGERLFGFDGSINQVENVIRLLVSKPSSRRAVIQLFDASDLEKNYKSIPCTCTLQFVIREHRLNLLVNMRSNDAYLGLPHDVFAFTMLQEIVARSVGVDVGIYQHCAGSLHLYEDHRSKAKNYLDEGWMGYTHMSPMPCGDPWSAIRQVIAITEEIRNKKGMRTDMAGLDPYWRDICNLLLWFKLYKAKDVEACSNLKSSIGDKAFHVFIEDKLANL